MIQINNKKKGVWIILFICLLIFAWICSQNDRKSFVLEILNSKAITGGIITDFGHEKGKAEVGYYNFTVNGKIINGRKADGRLRKIENLLVNKTFPVIYNSKNPEQNQLLIFKTDFDEFNLTYPESLNWISLKLKR